MGNKWYANNLCKGNHLLAKEFTWIFWSIPLTILKTGAGFLPTCSLKYPKVSCIVPLCSLLHYIVSFRGYALSEGPTHVHKGLAGLQLGQEPLLTSRQVLQCILDQISTPVPPSANVAIQGKGVRIEDKLTGTESTPVR